MCACPVNHLNYEGATDKTCHDDDAPGRLAALFDKQCHQRCRAGNGAADCDHTMTGLPSEPGGGRVYRSEDDQECRAPHEGDPREVKRVRDDQGQSGRDQ
jgi:hypothetical protein